MSDNADDPLTLKALEQLADLQAQAARLRAFVNQADQLNGRPPRFPDVAADLTSTTAFGAPKRPSPTWAPGTFFNKPFQAAVKQILLDRFEHQGSEKPAPASVDEIHEALAQGSFDFRTSGVDSQKQSIQISLGKNSATFVRLPNTDLFGLVDWYGKKLGRPRRPNGEKSTSSPVLQVEEEVEDWEKTADDTAAPEEAPKTEDRE